MKTVCIAVDHKYSDNDGAWSVFYMWDGEKVFTEGGMYSVLAYDAYEVDATREQLEAASDWARANTPYGNNWNKYANNRLGAYTFVGCIVTLARSRKAPNKTPLKVVAHHDRYFDQRFGNWVDEKVTVKDESGETYTVSIGCIKEVIQGVQNLPFWVI